MQLRGYSSLLSILELESVEVSPSIDTTERALPWDSMVVPVFG
jgi:hypothetical protein